MRCSACARRQRAMRPWSPLRSTSGTSQPRNSAGRVYCGSSSSPRRPKLSVIGLTSLPMTPGTRRVTASTTRQAATSPPASTTSPTLSSSSTRCSRMRWSTPSYRPHSKLKPSVVGQLVGDVLVESSPGRSEEVERTRRVDGLDGGEHRLRPHQHARAATERAVVDRAVHVRRVRPQIVGAQVEQAGGARLAEQAGAAEVVDHGREDGEDVDAHSGLDLEQPFGRVDHDAFR